MATLCTGMGTATVAMEVSSVLCHSSRLKRENRGMPAANSLSTSEQNHLSNQKHISERHLL